MDGDVLDRRLRWRCRRGTREMDLILDRFLSDSGANLDEEMRQNFDRLLDRTDQELLDWIHRRSVPPDPGLAAIADRIRASCALPREAPQPVLHDPRMAVVAVRGPDAAAFLHAQLTSDVESMTAGSMALSAWCNPRGQVRNLFWLVRRPDGRDFSLVAPSLEADGLAQRLRMFVLRAKVEVERTEEHVLGAVGSGSEAFVSGWAGAVPGPGRAVGSGPRMAMRPPRPPARFLVTGPDPLSAAASGTEWRRLDIEAGIAWLAEATRESFIPQMLNLDRLDALSFDKGCYPGQEIIARTRYLGRLKRRLFRAWTAAGRAPQPGVTIRSADQVAGTIVAAEPDTNNEGHALLAVLRTDRVDDALELDDGRPVRVRPAD